MQPRLQIQNGPIGRSRLWPTPAPAPHSSGQSRISSGAGRLLGLIIDRRPPLVPVGNQLALELARGGCSMLLDVILVAAQRGMDSGADHTQSDRWGGVRRLV